MQPRREKVVSDSRFPPASRRGFGSPFTQSVWGISAAEYIKGANERVTVMIQIETQDGVKNVEEIAAVDGIGQYGNRLIMSLN